jgi:release factor glutamine methyltransferase
MGNKLMGDHLIVNVRAATAGRVGAIDRYDEIVTTLRAAGCVFAEEEARLLLGAAPDPAALDGMVARRVGGQPLEHVVGWVDFGGVRVELDPGVFVPRQRTTLLVREAAVRTTPGSIVVDLACGSGAVGLALASVVGPVELYAVDVDPASVRCAARNLAPLGGRTYTGDLYDPLPDAIRGRVDVLVANVPYVPSAAVDLMPREARMYEPRLALDGGTDGLDVLRRVARGAAEWLVPGGYLLSETGADQAATALDVLARAGLEPTVVRDEELGATVVVGRTPPRPTVLPYA